MIVSIVYHEYDINLYIVVFDAICIEVQFSFLVRDISWIFMIKFERYATRQMMCMLHFQQLLDHLFNSQILLFGPWTSFISIVNLST